MFSSTEAAVVGSGAAFVAKAPPAPAVWPAIDPLRAQMVTTNISTAFPSFAKVYIYNV